MSKKKQTRIKISDLPADSTVSVEELSKITGGFYETGYPFVSIYFPQGGGRRASSIEKGSYSAIPINIP